MLTGKLVTLRPIKMEDWEKTLKWRNDLLIKTSTMSHPFPITQEQEQEWYNNKLNSFDNKYLYFAIIRHEDDELIGYIHLNSIDWISRNAYFGVVIGDQSNFGKGYGKEAVCLLLSYGFENLNLNKIYAYVLENHPAIKTYYDIGAKLEGTLKQHFFHKNKYENVSVLAWYQKNLKNNK